MIIENIVISNINIKMLGATLNSLDKEKTFSLNEFILLMLQEFENQKSFELL